MSRFDPKVSLNGPEVLKDNLHSVIALPDNEPSHHRVKTSNIRVQNFDNHEHENVRMNNDYDKARAPGQTGRTSSTERIFVENAVSSESGHNDNIHDASSIPYPRQNSINTLKNQMHKFESRREDLLKTIHEEASKNNSKKLHNNPSTSHTKSDADNIQAQPSGTNQYGSGGEDNFGFA